MFPGLRRGGEPRCGLLLSYAVQVVNGPHRVLSDSVHALVGSRLPHAVELPPLVSPTRDEIYLRTGRGDTLLAVSTLTHSVVARRPVQGGPGAMRADGEALFVIASENQVDSLYTLAPGTLDAVSVAPMPPGPQRFGPLAAGRPGRIYLVGTDHQTGVTWIDVVDTGSGAELARLEVSATASSNERTFLAVSPDGSRLYVAKASEVIAVDVSTDSPDVVDTTTLPYTIGALALAPDGARLYVGRAWLSTAVVDVLDAATFSSIRQVPAPGLFNIFATSEHLYLSLGLDGRPGDRYFLSGDVVRLDRATLSEVDRRGFVMVPSWIGVSRDGSFLYAQGPTSTTLVVPTW